MVFFFEILESLVILGIQVIQIFFDYRRELNLTKLFLHVDIFGSCSLFVSFSFGLVMVTGRVETRQISEEHVLLDLHRLIGQVVIDIY